MSAIKPSILRPGDLIGVIAPAGPVTDLPRIERGVRYLEALGYRVLPGEHLTDVDGYLAGSDANRLEDLHAMFRNTHVRAIICLRGGYGTPRLLSRIDYRLIRRHPKILAGFSDITALQLALWKKCRLVTFHGPMVASDMAETMDPVAEESFWGLLTSRKKRALFEQDAFDLHILHSGTARGPLLGGNLSLIVSILATPYSPDFSGAVLALEEIGEEPYRIDRMLNQLSLSRILPSVSGILAGQFTACVPEDTSRPSASVSDLLAEISGRIGKPFLAGVPFGHVPRKITLPLGVTVSMNGARASVKLLESAVE
jgi:muramoyltetrapeptide carboxypeptidase